MKVLEPNTGAPIHIMEVLIGETKTVHARITLEFGISRPTTNYMGVRAVSYLESRQ